MKSNTNIFYFVLIAGIALLSYILWNINYNEVLSDEKINESAFICGTPGPRSAEEHGGGAIFKANCAACHKIYKRMTGPALLHSTKAFPNDSSFHNYITKIKGTENNTLSIGFPDLTYEESSIVKAYIESF